MTAIHPFDVWPFNPQIAAVREFRLYYRSLTHTDRLARLRINLTYAWRHGRLPQLNSPSLFTELVQHRKLHDRNPSLPLMADKILVKEEVARVIGSDWIIPTLWQGLELPLRRAWCAPLVVKSRHGSNQCIFVRSPTEDWNKVRRCSRRWVHSRYGFWLDEWLYKDIPRGLLVEPFVGTEGALPIDYKLYVFGGTVAFIQVHFDRERAHRWIVLDRDWRPMAASTIIPAKPGSLSAMIEAAETLAGSLDFVRADFYEIAGKPKFGELTFYPGSGLDAFDPPELDAVMGAMWLGARMLQRPAPRCGLIPQSRTTPTSANLFGSTGGTTGSFSSHCQKPTSIQRPCL
jgi:TupA-like ATPgrasp